MFLQVYLNPIYQEYVFWFVLIWFIFFLIALCLLDKIRTKLSTCIQFLLLTMLVSTFLYPIVANRAGASIISDADLTDIFNNETSCTQTIIRSVLLDGEKATGRVVIRARKLCKKHEDRLKNIEENKSLLNMLEERENSAKEQINEGAI